MKPTVQAAGFSPFTIGSVSRIAFAALTVLGTTRATLATPIELSPTGLAEPESIITFSEHTLGDTAAVSEEFADLGVTFLPNLYYRIGDHPDWANVEGPNLRTGEPEVNPFVVRFESAVTAAALIAIAQPPTPATITARLDGVVIESFETTVSIDNPDNFFGFTDIVFNEIEIAYTADTRMRIDNVQLGMAANLAPLAFTNIDVTEGKATNSVLLTWQSRPRRSYSMFTSDDLQTWIELSDGIESGGDETSFTDGDAPANVGTRFYRAQDTTG